MSPCSGRERAIHYCLPDGALFSSVSHVSGPLFSEGSFITGYGKGGMILRGGTDGRDRFTVFRSASFCLAQRFRSDQRRAAGVFSRRLCFPPIFDSSRDFRRTILVWDTNRTNTFLLVDIQTWLSGLFSIFLTIVACAVAWLSLSLSQLDNFLNLNSFSAR